MHKPQMNIGLTEAVCYGPIFAGPICVSLFS